MDEKHTNIKQIKEYVEFYYKSQSETFDRIDVRLIGVAGFSSVLLKFIDDFKKVSSIGLVLDVFSCVFFLASVGCCFLVYYLETLASSKGQKASELTQIYILRIQKTQIYVKQPSLTALWMELSPLKKQ